MKTSATKTAIAQRIKELRREQGVTQVQFAQMCGLNRSYLADIEKGNRNFGIDTLERIVTGFGVTFDEFFENL